MIGRSFAGAASRGGKGDRASNAIIFQDVLDDYYVDAERISEEKVVGGSDSDSDRNAYDDHSGNETTSISELFFELANAPLIGYRLGCCRDDKEEEEEKQETTVVISIEQDITDAAQQHTGGIVWETSYLLLEYLLCRNSSNDDDREAAFHCDLGGRTIELGAGCGLLGQVLYYYCNYRTTTTRRRATTMVMTETEPVLTNLKANIRRNQSIGKFRRKKTSKRVKKRKKGENIGPDLGSVGLLECCSLDWLEYRRDMRLNPTIFDQPFDTILGTDVVFAPALVKPFLATMEALCHSETVAYLCLQVRCPTSHQLLLDTAKEYNFDVTDATNELASVPSCRWGLELECRLFRLTRIKTEKNELASAVCLPK